MAVVIAGNRLDQSFDFSLSQILADAQLGIRLAAVPNCPHFVGRR
jgi:hypothetical protein